MRALQFEESGIYCISDADNNLVFEDRGGEECYE